MTGMENASFFRVLADLRRAPTRDYLMHGYESERDFRRALWRLVGRWQGRVGERVGERHGFYLLRFHDTPGGKPEEEWLPSYLLEQTAIPDYLVRTTSDSSDERRAELDQAFGFD